MVADVMKLLDQVGYTCIPSDEELISLLEEKVKSDMLSYMNLSELPEEMVQDLELAVMGEFLSFKKNTGQLELSNMKFWGFSEIREGDTTVVTGSGQTEVAKFEQFVSYCGNWKEKAISFRSLVW